jgi:hypothetical protein
MAKRKVPTQPDIPTDENSPPPWVKPRTRGVSVLKNASIDDYFWFGEDGNLDATALKAKLFSPEAALRQILGAIIDAHPREDRASRDVRLADAIWALTGKSSSKRGPKEASSDEQLLSIVAREYFRDVYRLTPKKRSLAALVRLALRETKVDSELNRLEIAPEIRRLQKKFKLSKDELLVAVGEQSEVEAVEHRNLVMKTLEALSALGIKIRMQ